MAGNSTGAAGGTWSPESARGLLLGAVRASWEAGYQPADLIRAAARRLDGGDAALLREVVGAELAGYPPDTIDSRWRGQLAELGIDLPKPADPAGHRRSRAVPWAQVAARAVPLLHLLHGLPRLERLGPLPGAGPAPGAGGAGPGVDPRILSRVRALLAKAESTPYPAEAETFTAGAQALMARHSIDAALLDAGEAPRTSAPTAVRIGIDNPYEAPKTALLTAVARANRCRTVWAKELGFCTVVGFPADVQVAETLFTSLLVQATRAMTREGSRTDDTGRSRTRAFRHSFLLAYGQRIGERLSQTRARVEGEAGGEALLPVLAARDLEVDRAMTELFPRLRRTRRRSITDWEGWSSGRAAADLADVGPRSRLRA